MNARIVANYAKDAIECARAKGWSKAFTATELHVDLKTVEKVWAAMDVINAEADRPNETSAYGKGLMG